jgi:hypothetical protein
MASKSRQAFDRNVKDIERLLEIHADVGGDTKGRRFGLEVLNKSAIVLITAIWEAYCEDLAAEALENLVANVSSGLNLPKELKKKIVSDIEADRNDLAMWDLADGGWKVRAKARVKTLMTERNRRLNTPKSDQINGLFNEAIGLSNVSSAWYWKKMSNAQARKKLDNFVELRGAIAHRGTSASGVKKAQVTGYLALVKRIVGKTGGRVNTHVRGATGKPLW